MYCTNCGVKNSDTAKFCRNCGSAMIPEQPPAEGVEEATVPLGGEWQNYGNEVQGDGSSQGESSYGNNRSYGEPTYGNGQPYGEPTYGNGQPYGEPVYGNGQPYGGPAYGNGQPYGGPAYGNGQPYGEPVYGNGQSYGSQGYGNGAYGNTQGYGGGQPYETAQYGNQSYGYPSYGTEAGTLKKKKSKKGLVIALVVILLAALAGGGVFLYVKESDPMAPVDRFFDGIKEGKWEKVYDSIYWGEEGSSDWSSKEEFAKEAMESMGGLSSMTGVLDALKFKKVSEGDSYEGPDGLTRKQITVEMSVTFMGMNQSQEVDFVVVKEGKTFLFIPTWKIDNESMSSLF